MKYVLMFWLVIISSIVFGQGQSGWFRGYYENGQLKKEMYLTDGKLDGLMRMYYENGQLKFEINYKNNRQDGIDRAYYENGQLRYENNFKDGELISNKCWNESGKVIDCR